MKLFPYSHASRISETRKTKNIRDKMMVFTIDDFSRVRDNIFQIQEWDILDPAKILGREISSRVSSSCGYINKGKEFGVKNGIILSEFLK